MRGNGAESEEALGTSKVRHTLHLLDVRGGRAVENLQGGGEDLGRLSWPIEARSVPAVPTESAAEGLAWNIKLVGGLIRRALLMESVELELIGEPATGHGNRRTL